VNGRQVWVVLVAAGAGERLVAAEPKAFVPFAGRPLVASSLTLFDTHPAVDGIVVVVPAGFEQRLEAVSDEVAATKVAAAVAGGATRQRSVAHGLDSVPRAATHVLVHDAARPLVTASVVDRVLAAMTTGVDGVVPVLPVTDTIKRVGVDGVVLETVDRASLRAAQTPQGFPAGVLRKALRSTGSEATDCSTLVQAGGGRVVCVDGDPWNLKLTTGEDLSRLEAHLAAPHRHPTSPSEHA
jgi:2-C-methyl-D-erythritol 4-phosphate cytidylyltransferase